MAFSEGDLKRFLCSWKFDSMCDVRLVSPEDMKPSSEAVAEYLEGRRKYEELRKQKRKKGSSREEQVKELDVR